MFQLVRNTPDISIKLLGKIESYTRESKSLLNTFSLSRNQNHYKLILELGELSVDLKAARYDNVQN